MKLAIEHKQAQANKNRTPENIVFTGVILEAPSF